MEFPVYTELSNFTARKGGKKAKTDLTIALVIGKFSEPVDTINSIYNYITESEYNCEVLIINVDKVGYKYDKLLSTFPALRVLIPQQKIKMRDAIMMAGQESLSKYILFIGEDFKIKSMDLDFLGMYLNQSDFGIMIPVIYDEQDEIIPNIVKGNPESGFLKTISMKIRGTAITSLYPKYFCFMLNRPIFLERIQDLDEYETTQFALLELGYKVWRNGYLVFQAANFKVQFNGEPMMDISYDENNDDYMRFNLINFQDKQSRSGRGWKILRIFIRSLFTFRFKTIGRLNTMLVSSKEHSRKGQEYPMDNDAVFKTINKDIK